MKNVRGSTPTVITLLLKAKTVSGRAAVDGREGARRMRRPASSANCPVSLRAAAFRSGQRRDASLSTGHARRRAFTPISALGGSPAVVSSTGENRSPGETHLRFKALSFRTGLRHRLQTMRKAIEDRCKLGGLELDEVIDEVEDGIRQHYGWTVGRKGEAAAHLGHEEDLERAAFIDFEEWHPVQDFNAAFRESVLEVEIEIHSVRALRKAPFTAAEKVLNAKAPFFLPKRADGVHAIIGWASPELMFWRAASPNVHSIGEDLVPVLRLEGINVGFDPAEVLERIGAAALFEFWRATGTLARFRRHEPWSPVFGPATHEPTGVLLAPNVGPALVPLELFANAAFQERRDAEFLSLYRVAEFFFARAVYEAHVDRLQADTEFSNFSHKELMGIVERLSPRFDEVTGMKAIVQRVFATDADLFEVLRRYHGFQERFLDQLGLSTSNTARAELGKYLYGVRCDLVHAKEGRSIKLPTGHDVAHLPGDVTVMEVIANRLLTAFSTQTH